MKEGRVYLIHIRDCINRINQYTVEGKEAFFNDIKTQHAVHHWWTFSATVVFSIFYNVKFENSVLIFSKTRLFILMISINFNCEVWYIENLAWKQDGKIHALSIVMLILPISPCMAFGACVLPLLK